MKQVSPAFSKFDYENNNYMLMLCLFVLLVSFIRSSVFFQMFVVFISFVRSAIFFHFRKQAFLYEAQVFNFFLSCNKL